MDQAWARTASPHLHATIDDRFHMLVANLLVLRMCTVVAAVEFVHDVRGSSGHRLW